MDRKTLGPVLTIKQLSELRSILADLESSGTLLTLATKRCADLLRGIDCENRDTAVLVESAALREGEKG